MARGPWARARRLSFHGVRLGGAFDRALALVPPSGDVGQRPDSGVESLGAGGRCLATGEKDGEQPAPARLSHRRR